MRGRGSGAPAARAAGRVAVAIALCSWASAAGALCRPTAVTPMTFTGYAPTGPAVAATATITYVCNGNVTSADIGVATPRTMTAGAGTLAFELYREAAHATVFPDAPPLAIPVVPTGTVTVYGLLPPQDAAPGTYAVALAITLTSNGSKDKTRTLGVSAVVAPVCTIASGALSFGSYDPLAGSPRDAQGTISITCSRGTAYAVALGPGSNAVGGVRQLASGSERLQYGLFSDAGRTSPWDGVRTVSGTAPSTAPIPLVVYGRVPPGQAVAAGAYADVVQSTINF